MVISGNQLCFESSDHLYLILKDRFKFPLTKALIFTATLSCPHIYTTTSSLFFLYIVPIMKFPFKQRLEHQMEI